MTTKNIFLTVVILFLLNTVSYSQMKYGIFINYGNSNFIEKNKEEAVVIGNKYTKLPSYTIGANIFYSLEAEKKCIFESGISFTAISAKNTVAEDIASDSNFVGQSNWNEQFYSIDVPLIFRYKFEKWVHIRAGVTNSFILNEPKEITINKINHYTLSLTGGIDFLIKQKLIVGFNYYRNITSLMQVLQTPNYSDTYDIKYYAEQISFKIGYIIN